MFTFTTVNTSGEGCNMPTTTDFSDFRFGGKDQSADRQQGNQGQAGEYGQAGPFAPDNPPAIFCAPGVNQSGEKYG